MKEIAEELNKEFRGQNTEEVIKAMLERFKGKIALASSMGAEDQVLTDMVLNADKNADIFTLDTGRVFPETYDLIQRTNSRYGINIRVMFPDHKRIEEMVNSKGINLFYDSVENRKLCCHIRKIEPLQRALSTLDVWITGLRRSQSVTRTHGQMIEWDENNGLIKFNPLIEWSEEDVWDYIHENNVPYHRLHDKGFPSIGCQPCTRAIEPGEDVRAGRWWWENPELKECGLHAR
jgi:phosphoadenosine phosphosulfate reductase